MKKLVLLFLLATMLVGCEDMPIGDVGDDDGGGGGDDFAIAMHHQSHSPLPYVAGPVIAPGTHTGR